jgi:hypothetical protein
MNWKAVFVASKCAVLLMVFAAVAYGGRLWEYQSLHPAKQYNVTIVNGTRSVPVELQHKLDLRQSAVNITYVGLGLLSLMFFAESKLDPDHWINHLRKVKVTVEKEEEREEEEEEL